MIRVRRLLLRAFGGLYNDLIGRRSHLGAAAVIFDADGRVLLVRHSYGRRNWELPGGGRKAHESVEQAVRREVREEVGVEAVIERLTGIYYEPEMDQHHFAFRCRLPEGVAPHVSSAELLACDYWPVDTLPRPISDFTMRRIEDARAGGPPPSVAILGPRRWMV
jgi:8-oxo-dGTP pyrophosphatase MutT (NUDIX family)